MSKILTGAFALVLLGVGALPEAAAEPPANLVTSATVIMIENHGRSATRAKLPRIVALGARFAEDTNARAVTHPSKPNYLVVWSGSRQGEDSNRFALETAPSLYDLVAASGDRVKTYAQSMGSDRCRMGNNGAYVRRHDPHAYFTVGSITLPNGTVKTKRAECEERDRDAFTAKYPRWTDDLRNNRLGKLNHVVPDNNHNWHDGSAATADAWISARANEFIASQAYADGGALIITADEDEKAGENDIPLYVIHKSLDGSHFVTGTRLTLYDLHAFLAEVAHVRPGGGTPNLFASTFGLAT